MSRLARWSSKSRPAVLAMVQMIGLAGCTGVVGPVSPPNHPAPQPPETAVVSTTDAGGASPALDAGSLVVVDAGSPVVDAGTPPPPRDDAEIVSFVFPPSLSCSQVSTATVVVKNTGTTTWTDAESYKLGAVGDSDPLSPEGRVRLPASASVPPNGTWQFTVDLTAPATQANAVSDWQMLKENVAWFGGSMSTPVSVTCPVVTPPTPDIRAVVNAVAAQYPQLLTINTYESTGEFTQRVLQALNDPDWGHVAKTAGEGQYTPPGFTPRVIDGYTITGFSHDVVFHKPSNQQVDLLGNASANSDPNPAIWGPATVTYNLIPQMYYRPNNPWMAAVPP